MGSFRVHIVGCICFSTNTKFSNRRVSVCFISILILGASFLRSKKTIELESAPLGVGRLFGPQSHPKIISTGLVNSTLLRNCVTRGNGKRFFLLLSFKLSITNRLFSFCGHTLKSSILATKAIAKEERLSVLIGQNGRQRLKG